MTTPDPRTPYVRSAPLYDPHAPNANPLQLVDYHFHTLGLSNTWPTRWSGETLCTVDPAIGDCKAEWVPAAVWPDGTDLCVVVSWTPPEELRRDGKTGVVPAGADDLWRKRTAATADALESLGYVVERNGPPQSPQTHWDAKLLVYRMIPGHAPVLNHPDAWAGRTANPPNYQRHGWGLDPDPCMDIEAVLADAGVLGWDRWALGHRRRPIRPGTGMCSSHPLRQVLWPPHADSCVEVTWAACETFHRIGPKGTGPLPAGAAEHWQERISLVQSALEEAGYTVRWPRRPWDLQTDTSVSAMVYRPAKPSAQGAPPDTAASPGGSAARGEARHPWSLASLAALDAAARSAHPCAGLGHDRARWARLQGHLLGGGVHFAPDRALAQELTAADAGIRALAHASQVFLTSRVAALARQGIDQYVVLGCGYPAPSFDALHTAALVHRPAARIVYTDADLSVLAHARALLTAPAPAAIGHLHLDLAEPAALAPALRSLPALDLERPVALILANVLEQLTDEQAHQGVAALRRLVGAGSVLTLSHHTLEHADGQIGRQVRLAYRRAGIAYHPRTRAGLAALLEGWQLHSPHITELAPLPQPGPASARGARSYAATARKGEAGAWTPCRRPQ